MLEFCSGAAARSPCVQICDQSPIEENCRLQFEVSLLRRTLPFALAFLSGLTTVASAQSLTMYSGNGQVVLEQFLTTVPMTVLARDARGNPVAGVPVTWSLPQGAGTIVRPAAQTDANGLATADFLGTGVPFGLSYMQATVTASASAYGSANFFITTSIIRLPGGGSGSPPLVELFNPTPENLTVIGRANAILPGAVRVRVSVASGPQAGTLLPNIGINIHLYSDDEPQPSPFAACRGGTVLTDASGVATCDLILNDHLGQVQLSAVAGEVQKTRPFLLTITPGAPCTNAISPPGQSFAAAGGTGTISLTTGNNCSWAAASNANWVVLSGAVAGTTSANIGYAVATNSGAARSATITVGSQVFVVTQAAAGTTGSPLTISTASPLSAATAGTAYSLALQSSGGTPPYQWTASALPSGMILNGTILAGTPATAGTYSINLTVTDAALVSVTRTFGLTVATTPVTPTGPAITNAGFAGGTVGQPYRQAVTFVTSCTSPFGFGPTLALTSGSLPAGLSLTSPVDKTWVIAGTPVAGGNSNFVLTITEVCGRTSTASFLLAISGFGGGGGGGTVGAITASQQSISFTVGAGSTTKPGDVIVSLSSLNGAALNYTAFIANMTGGTWLTITNGAAGTTPTSLTLSAGNFQTFAAGTYTAQLALQTAGNATVFVPVTLVVSNAAPMTVTPSALVFTSPVLLAPGNLQQTLQISAGAGGAHFTTGFSTESQNNWMGVTPGVGDTPAALTVVVNAVGLRPGTYTGKVLIMPTNGVVVTVPVTLIVTVPPALSWSVPAVDNSYITHGPTPVPVTVNLASSSSNLQYQVSNTQVGWLTVTPRIGMTPNNLTLVFDPTGLAPGVYQTVLMAVSIGVSTQPVTLPVSFSVRQSAPTISAILHGASFLPVALAPGLQVQIMGSNLGPLTQADSTPGADSGQYPTALAGARVLFDDYAAPVLHASDRQITVLVPYSVAGKASVRVVVEYRFAQSIPQLSQVADSSPGLFTGAGSQGIILNEDGSYNGPAAGANPGSIVSILGSGEGQTNPAGIDGMVMQDGSLASPVLPVTAQIGGLNAEVVSATSAPGQPAGVFLIKVRVPDDAPRGAVVAVMMTIGSASSQDGVTIVIAP